MQRQRFCCFGDICSIFRLKKVLVFSCAGYSADRAFCKFLLAQQAVYFPEGSKLQHFGWQGQLQDVLAQLELTDPGR